MTQGAQAPTPLPAPPSKNKGVVGWGGGLPTYLPCFPSGNQKQISFRFFLGSWVT